MTARNAIRRMNRARTFPGNTCGTSRAVANMARALATFPQGAYIDDPDAAVEDIVDTVAMLWQARSKLRELGWTWKVDARGVVRWVKVDE